ncbi:TetR/AcrR family transcriptional regulator [Streptomyces lunaelactis]|uniref:TetR/AcrR family transcriptional regulator n=1 Tax=Streptomyces lunaelactis TaxID=1535768 RepID=UPI001585CF24|nr:TetR family transcriptional regulator [Streptomyces lunaelactis]NUK28131.1 TetR/AcrR family transcriptional regulator [Streptomyces lunaelactis]
MVKKGKDAERGRKESGRRSGDRGRYGRLSRERVLAAALELVDREGLSALSMRRVGAELGVEAMALYRYAPSKDALLDGLVEALFIELQDYLDATDTDTDTDAHAAGTGAGEAEATAAGSSPEGPEWRTELHRIALATYRVALAHPQVVPLVATRMLAVPLAQRPLAVLLDHERVLTLFEEAGLDENKASLAFRAFNSWVLGYIFVELRAMVDNPEESDPAFRLGLHRMPVQELPRLRRTAPALAEHGGPEGLAAGLSALLDRFVQDVV